MCAFEAQTLYASMQEHLHDKWVYDPISLGAKSDSSPPISGEMSGRAKCGAKRSGPTAVHPPPYHSSLPYIDKTVAVPVEAVEPLM